MGCSPIKRKAKTSITKKGLIEEEKENKQSTSKSLPITNTNQRNSYKKHVSVDYWAKQQSSELINAKLHLHNKTSKDYEHISKSLISHFLFNSMSESHIISVIDQFKLYLYSGKTVVCEQGSPGDNFFIVAAGRVEVIVNGIKKKIMSKGEQFGEIALLHNTLRTATIKTVEQTYLWALSRGSFKEALLTIHCNKLKENKHFFDSVPVFEGLNYEQKEVLLSLIVTHEFHEGQKIVQEGDPGDLVYIIQKGQVSCSKDGKEIRKLSQGSIFGEQALLYNTSRTATVIAIGKVTLLSLGREDLKTAFGSHFQEIVYKNTLLIAIEKSKCLKSLNKVQIDNLINKVRIFSYKSGEKVVLKGLHKQEKIFIVVKGCIKSTLIKLDLYLTLGDEEIFKENKENWEEDWVADVDSDIGIISKLELESVIGGNFETVTTQNEILSVLKKVQILRGLPYGKLEVLAERLKITKFASGEKIFEEGDESENFFIIKQGQVEIFRNGVSIRVITKNDYFGERSIIMNEKRTAAVFAMTETECWTLSKTVFLELVDENMRKQLIVRMHLQNDKINLSDLIVIKLLGKGMFGNVFLVYNSETNVYYALKTVERSRAIFYDICENLVLERKILLQVDHPLIIKLVKTFKDPYRLYFLIEYVQGIDLFDTLRELGLLNNESSKFYTACLVLIFEHLHEHGIIYRDLKPENIMIDLNGYPKLIDFGTAKFLENRTFTLVGTPHYMAPEIINGSGYGLGADIWSMGIMLYEFICGCVPFGDDEEDPYKIYAKILEHNIKYPNYIISSKCKPIIEKMLEPNQLARSKIDNIKDHPWFYGIAWESLLTKSLKPPYLPKPENLNPQLLKAQRSAKRMCSVVRTYEDTEERLDQNKAIKKQPPLNWDEEF